MSKKLFKITLQNHKICYAVATDPTKAYETAREVLDDWDYFFSKERELWKIEVIADKNQYQECGAWLFT